MATARVPHFSTIVFGANIPGMIDVKKTLAHATNTFPEVIFYYVSVLAICGTFYSFLEDKPWFDSMWWACVTGLTIGYGDMVPVTTGGKVVALALMHIVPLVIIPLIIAKLLTSVMDDKNAFTDEEQEQMKADLRAIKTALKIAD